MYICVIPTSKSQGKNPYFYEATGTWEDQIQVGGLVEIPFGKEIVLGIVSSIEEALPSNMEKNSIRPIHSVLSSTPLLDDALLSVIFEISNRYFLPIHKALALFLPAPLLHRLSKKNYLLNREKRNNQEGAIRGEIIIHHFLRRTFAPHDLGKYLQPGTVIIFPDDVMLFSFFGKHESGNFLILPTEATQTRRVQGWMDIYEGKYEIIVGTRRLLYYNLSAYKNLLYIEDAFGSEQYQYPISIRSLDVLGAIALSGRKNITVVSSSPTLELWSKFPNATIVTIS